MDNKCFSFEKSIKNLENIHDKANIMSYYYKTMTKTDYENWVVKYELLVF